MAHTLTRVMPTDRARVQCDPVYHRRLKAELGTARFHAFLRDDTRYLGAAHPPCGTRERMTANGRCIRCEQRRKNLRKHEKRLANATACHVEAARK